MNTSLHQPNPSPTKKLKASKPRITLLDGRELQYHRPREREQSAELLKLLPSSARNKKLEIEIGPGKGEFLARRASKFPQRFFVGIDKLSKRVELTEKKLKRQSPEQNWLILKKDARAFLQKNLNPIEVFHVYQPDPWPKARHHKHRFFRSPDARRWCEALVNGGQLRFSTDHKEYFAEILDIVQSWQNFDLAFVCQKTAIHGEPSSHFEGIFLRQNLPVWKAVFVKKS